jgi:hypothetical protein
VSLELLDQSAYHLPSAVTEGDFFDAGIFCASYAEGLLAG